MNTQHQQKAIGALLLRKQNALCADCNSKSPCWASLDFGVFICLNCSGGHRALGPSITRVKSTKLDTWNRDWLDNMKIGNTIINQYWQYQLTGLTKTIKPNINTSLSDITKFIQDKYIKRKYINPNQSLDPLKRSKLQKEQNETVQKQIPQTFIKQIPKPTTKPNLVSFEPFNSIVGKQKVRRRSSDNLISFDIKQIKGDPHLLNAHQQPQNKYNHSQFHTVSGSTNHEALINFDNLIKHESQLSNSSSHSSHQNYFFGQNSNQVHHQHHHNPSQYQHSNHNHTHISQSMPPVFDKAQYVTMNINMNMYPKVMNINMSPYPQQNYYQGSNLPVNSPNTDFSKQFLGQTAKNQENNTKISMNSNINLNTNAFEKKQDPKSWVDQWK